MTLHTSLGAYRRYATPTTVQKSAAGDLNAKIQALATKLEPGLAEAVLAVLDAQKGAVDLEALASALEAGDVGAVLRMLDLDEYTVAAGPVGKELTSGVMAGGALAATQINVRITEARFTFGELNPALINWLQTYQLNLIRQIDTATKEGVRQVLTSAMQSGTNPKQAASQIKQIVGLTSRQSQAVMNYRKQLETIHVSGAGGMGLGNKIDRVNGTQVFRPDEDGRPKDKIYERRLRDFRYDGKLQAAVNTGKALSAADIDKMVDAYARKYVRYRAMTIARSESMRTVIRGVRAGWESAISSGTVDQKLLRRSWILTEDERLCEICAPIPSLNPKRGVRFDQPFNTPEGKVMSGPMHPSCRCTEFIQLFEPEQLDDGEDAEQLDADEDIG